jgi:hypothetical protein
LRIPARHSQFKAINAAFLKRGSNHNADESRRDAPAGPGNGAGGALPDLYRDESGDHAHDIEQEPAAENDGRQA